ncbi:MAG TPA: acyltransferase [Polyangia bacterium]|nr:acyltransferase [Polyangia bacterium]
MHSAAGVRPVHRHYPYLDGLRGLAILLVLVGHAIPGLLPLAGTGVMVFFVLSGFLITSILNEERRHTGTVSLRRFYIRRTLRIFPAYYTMVAIVALLAVFGLVAGVDFRNVVICALYLRNLGGTSQVLGHAWSLALEEQFYVLWPTMFLAMPRAAGRAARVTACLIAGMTLFRTLAIINHWGVVATGVFYARPWFRFDSLWIGCAIALWTAHGVDGRFARRFALVPTAAWIAALLAWSLVARSPALAPVSETLSMLLAGGLLLRLRLADDGWVGWIMRSSFMRWLGKLSYSLYLWQQLFLIAGEGGPDWGIARVFPVNILLLFAAALASYHLVERPFLRLKDRLAPQA